jgi:hypothetical protein
MSTIPHPLQNNADWRRVLIGGSVLPGKLTDVAVPSRKFNWNVRKGFGMSMVTVFQNVDILSGISFTHFLDLKTTGADDWALLETFLRTLLPKWPTDVQVKPKSLPVVYPLLQFLGAKRIHLAEFFAPKPPQNEKIPQYYTIVFQEDVPDKRPPTGPAEPAQLNGVPKPKDLLDATLLQGFADWKGTSIGALLATPPLPTEPAAIATGRASK